MSDKIMQVTKAAEKPPAMKLPEGWWSLNALEGSRIGVLAAVDASDAPDGWKAALCAEIGALDAKLNHVKLHAHCQSEKGHIMLNIHIKASTVL